MMIVINTLNINGINSVKKQYQLIDFMRKNCIDILLLQEHNIRNYEAVNKDLEKFYHLSLNYAVSSKGGTAILINRNLPFEILSEEKSADSRIISLRVKIADNTSFYGIKMTMKSVVTTENVNIYLSAPYQGIWDVLF